MADGRGKRKKSEQGEAGSKTLKNSRFYSVTKVPPRRAHPLICILPTSLLVHHPLRLPPPCSAISSPLASISPPSSPVLWWLVPAIKVPRGQSAVYPARMHTAARPLKKPTPDPLLIAPSTWLTRSWMQVGASGDAARARYAACLVMKSESCFGAAPWQRTSLTSVPLPSSSSQRCVPSTGCNANRFYVGTTDYSQQKCR